MPDFITLGWILAAPLATLLLLAGSIVPLGCVLLWRRLAFFADALSHACVLGLVFFMALGYSPLLGLWMIGCVIVLILFVLERNKHHNTGLSIDTLLAVISYTFFSGGVVMMTLCEMSTLNIESLLFGDLLAIHPMDCAIAGGLALVTVLFWKKYHRLLILYCLNEDLAHVHSPHTRRVYAVFLILTALSVTFGMRAVGVLLLPALMIMPAAAIRPWCHNPLHMVMGSVIIFVLSSFSGILLSYHLQTTPAPTIVLCVAAFFIASHIFYSSRRLKQRYG